MANARETGRALVQRVAEPGGGMLRQIVTLAIEGVASVPGAKATAARHLQRHGDADAAIESLIRTHVALASAQGFATNLGGLATAVVALPANITGVAVLQVRLAATIAHLRGYDVDDPRVRTALLMCLLGDVDAGRRTRKPDLPRPLAVATAPVYDAGLDRRVSEVVLGDLAGRIGGKQLAVQLLRRVPLVGGPVGGAVDGYLTYAIGSYVKDELITRRMLR
ncbi:EcsC family protein [Propionicicella superfundia]|uniref:EcsC family protein n=1 Tax=Propionicicella superfundia TaxID=348582 RepID=UPI00040C12F7|nr:EcsC family protein [Propionicicella superfundia]